VILALYETSKPALEPAPPSIQRVSGCVPGLKRSEIEIDHWPASRVGVRNERSYKVSPPIFLHGLNKDDCAINSCFENILCYRCSAYLRLWTSLIIFLAVRKFYIFVLPCA